MPCRVSSLSTQLTSHPPRIPPPSQVYTGYSPSQASSSADSDGNKAPRSADFDGPGSHTLARSNHEEHATQTTALSARQGTPTEVIRPNVQLGPSKRDELVARQRCNPILAACASAKDGSAGNRRHSDDAKAIDGHYADDHDAASHIKVAEKRDNTDGSSWIDVLLGKRASRKHTGRQGTQSTPQGYTADDAFDHVHAPEIPQDNHRRSPLIFVPGAGANGQSPQQQQDAQSQAKQQQAAQQPQQQQQQQQAQPQQQQQPEKEQGFRPFGRRSPLFGQVPGQSYGPPTPGQDAGHETAGQNAGAGAGQAYGSPQRQSGTTPQSQPGAQPQQQQQAAQHQGPGGEAQQAPPQSKPPQQQSLYPQSSSGIYQPSAAQQQHAQQAQQQQQPQQPQQQQQTQSEGPQSAATKRSAESVAKEIANRVGHRVGGAATHAGSRVQKEATSGAKEASHRAKNASKQAEHEAEHAAEKARRHDRQDDVDDAQAQADDGKSRGDRAVEKVNADGRVAQDETDDALDDIQEQGRQGQHEGDRAIAQANREKHAGEAQADRASHRRHDAGEEGRREGDRAIAKAQADKESEEAYDDRVVDRLHREEDGERAHNDDELAQAQKDKADDQRHIDHELDNDRHYEARGSGDDVECAQQQANDAENDAIPPSQRYDAYSSNVGTYSGVVAHCQRPARKHHARRSKDDDNKPAYQVQEDKTDYTGGEAAGLGPGAARWGAGAPSSSGDGQQEQDKQPSKEDGYQQSGAFDQPLNRVAAQHAAAHSAVSSAAAKPSQAS